MNASGGIVEVVFTAHVQGAHSDRAPCMSTENTSAIPLLFLLLAFKLYPPPPLTNLLHSTYILVDPGAALRFSFAQNAIRAAAVLLHHLQRLFSKGGQERAPFLERIDHHATRVGALCHVQPFGTS